MQVDSGNRGGSRSNGEGYIQGAVKTEKRKEWKKTKNGNKSPVTGQGPGQEKGLRPTGCQCLQMYKDSDVFDFLTYSRETWSSFSYEKVGELTNRMWPLMKFIG